MMNKGIDFFECCVHDLHCNESSEFRDRITRKRNIAVIKYGSEGIFTGFAFPVNMKEMIVNGYHYETMGIKEHEQRHRNHWVRDSAFSECSIVTVQEAPSFIYTTRKYIQKYWNYLQLSLPEQIVMKLAKEANIAPWPQLTTNFARCQILKASDQFDLPYISFNDIINNRIGLYNDISNANSPYYLVNKYNQIKAIGIQHSKVDLLKRFNEIRNIEIAAVRLRERGFLSDILSSLYDNDILTITKRGKPFFTLMQPDAPDYIKNAVLPFTAGPIEVENENTDAEKYYYIDEFSFPTMFSKFFENAVKGKRKAIRNINLDCGGDISPVTIAVNVDVRDIVAKARLSSGTRDNIAYLSVISGNHDLVSFFNDVAFEKQEDMLQIHTEKMGDGFPSVICITRNKEHLPILKAALTR